MGMYLIIFNDKLYFYFDRVFKKIPQKVYKEDSFRVDGNYGVFMVTTCTNRTQFFLLQEFLFF